MLSPRLDILSRFESWLPLPSLLGKLSSSLPLLRVRLRICDALGRRTKPWRFLRRLPGLLDLFSSATRELFQETTARAVGHVEVKQTGETSATGSPCRSP